MLRSFKSRFIFQIAISLGVVVIIIATTILLSIGIKNVVSETMATQSKIDTKLQQIKNFAQLRVEAKRADILMPKLEKVLPSRDSIISFPTQLQKLADRRNVGVQFVFGSEGGNSIDFHATLRGEYKNIQMLIEDIEKELQFVSLSAFEMSRKDRSYNTTIAGKIFFKQ